ncbi:MAG: hypothetical protein NTY02_14020, partial [Acidobacteria bacterium]|nr:hypothetical protein [Acidobacteriota bacterium]
MVEPLILALDRFAGTGGETAIDLATGRPVCLLRERLGDVQRQRVRVTRAAVVASVRHWSIAPLLDYGPDGPDTWVDAFSTVSISVLSGCGGPAADGATESIDAGRRLLAAAGVTIAACNVRVGCDDAGRCLLVPQAYAESSEVGLEPDVERELGKSSRPLLAAVLQRRDELDQLIDVLEDSRATGPRRLIVEAPAGAGVSTLLLTFAREARLRGFVPVSSRLCRDSVMSGSCARVRRSSLVGCLERRHIVVLDDRRSAPACAADREAEAAARFLAELGSADGRPHLVVNVVAEPSAGAHVRVGPLRSDLLRRCTVAVGVAPADFAHTVDDAALRSAGLPGPYVAALASGIGDGPNDSPYRASGRAAAQVRETPAAAAPLPPQGARVGHPGAGHVAAAIADRSRQLAARGRHAAAERLLRRCLGALRRRGLFGEAGAVALQLGRLLATRGRFRAACETFEQARVLHDSDGHVVGVIASLMHAGQARLHDAQFTAAEATLHTAIVAAEQAGIRRLADAARLLLAGCLLSKGDPVAALALADRVRTPDLRSPEPGAAVAEHPVESHGAGRADWDHPSPGLWIPPGLQAVPVEIAVRAALADRDVGKAARCLAAWRLRAASEPSGAIAVAALDVLVKGALGDAEGAARACDAGIRQARDAHLPVHAMELRMSYARALADAGDSSSALQQLRRVDRRGITRLPGLVSQDLVALRARLRGPDLSGRPSRSSEDHVDAAAVLRLLRLWQDADDDRIATAGVCDVLRDVLAASAATAFVIGADGPRAVANAGSRPCRPALVDRCGGGLDTVGPETTCAGIEAAAR